MRTPTSGRPAMHHLMLAVAFLGVVPTFDGISAADSADVIDKFWWKKTVVYQIYPRSFYDKTGKNGTGEPDGVGDLKGIIEKLDYVKNLGIDTVWLSPFYKSPMDDFGYDIQDFKDIHDEFGTLQDFDDLITRSRELGLRILMDFVPGHTSYLHEWFQRSVDSVEPFKDYYVWHPGHPNKPNVTWNGTSIPDVPNDWVAVPGGSAWEWHPIRGQYYLHKFLKQQPSLNYRNQELKNAMDDVLLFWLEKGIAGFRVDAIEHVMQIPIDQMVDKNEAHLGDEHPFTEDLPETANLTRHWRDVVDAYSSENGSEPKVLIFEVYANMTTIVRYYGKADEPSFPFNFKFMGLNASSTGMDIHREVEDYMSHVPEGRFTTWVVGNHDQRRVADRLGRPKLVDGWNMLNLLLPGMPTTYYGEEIGMRNIEINETQVRDPFAFFNGSLKPDWRTASRDYGRSPMQWNNGTSAGFSTLPDTWLPLGSDYKNINVQVESDTEESHLKIYKQITKLRRENAFMDGSRTPALVTEDLYSFKRTDEVTGETYLVILDLRKDGANVVSYNFTSFTSAASNASVVVASLDAVYDDSDWVPLNAVSLRPSDSVVLRILSENSSIIPETSMTTVASVDTTSSSVLVVPAGYISIPALCIWFLLSLL